MTPTFKDLVDLIGALAWPVIVLILAKEAIEDMATAILPETGYFAPSPTPTPAQAPIS